MTSSAESATIESGTRARTRAAILDAAIRLLPTNPTATLAEVAEAAHVGRTTLHRYFSDRTELLLAATHLALQRVDRAVELVEPTRGPFLPAIRRTVDALLEHGPIIMFIYSEPDLIRDAAHWEKRAERHDYVLGPIFARQESNLREGLSVHWATKAFWALLCAGWESMEEGASTRQETVESIMITFASGVLAK